MEDVKITPFANRDHYLDAAELMTQRGGSFAGHIGRAFFAADSHNTQRLLGAFPDLFQRYRRMALEEAEQRAREQG